MLRGIQHFLARFRAAFRAEPFVLGSLWVGVFVLSFTLLFAAGIAPSAFVGGTIPQEENTEEGALAPNAVLASALGAPYNAHAATEDPMRIVIDRLDTDAPINNPQSRDSAVLDDALNSGVVHYPGSGTLADTSNLFLFAHSSGLPVVRNRAYKLFNNLDKLQPGDLIRVQSAGREYRYRVSSVSLVDADEAWVELSDREKRLTLSTCNSFGQLQERFVVEADFEKSVPFSTTG